MPLPMPKAIPPRAASPLAQPAPVDAGVKAIRAKTKLSQVESKTGHRPN